MPFLALATVKRGYEYKLLGGRTVDGSQIDPVGFQPEEEIVEGTDLLRLVVDSRNYQDLHDQGAAVFPAELQPYCI